MKIIAQWWTQTQNHECMGFILTENSSGVRKIYCGTGLGEDEEVDSKRITEYGGKIHASVLESMLSKLKEKGDYE